MNLSINEYYTVANNLCIIFTLIFTILVCLEILCKRLCPIIHYLTKENEIENDSFIFNERMNHLECRIEKMNMSVKEMKPMLKKEYAEKLTLDNELFCIRDEISILRRDFISFKRNQIKHDNMIESMINMGMIHVFEEMGKGNPSEFWSAIKSQYEIIK